MYSSSTKSKSFILDIIHYFYSLNIFYKKIELFLIDREGYSETEKTKMETSMTTQNVYVVLENGELYPTLYNSYKAAREAVLDKHAETLDDERSECAEWGGMMASKIDVVENTDTGTTKLYIEKEIYITIQRYRGLFPPV